MDRSQYLAMALQQMAEPAAHGAVGGVSGGLPVSQEEAAELMRRASAWRAANPGRSYTAHALGQAGQNLAAAPGRIAQGLGVSGGGLAGVGRLFGIGG